MAKKFWTFIGNDKYDIGLTGSTVYVYDKNGTELATFKDLTYAYNAVISPLGDIFVVKTTDGRMAIYSFEPLKLVKKFRFSKIDGGQDENMVFSPDGKYFVAQYSNVTTPNKVAIFPASGKKVRQGNVVADMQGPDYDASKYALGQLVSMTTEDGFALPGMIVYPKNFDPTKKYPVHVDIYGGPNTAMVRDRWVTPTAANQW